MVNNIELSVIIVTYNADKYIEKTIDSTLKAVEKLDKFEIIIIDNNSLDKTLEKITNFTNKEKKIKLKRLNENKGPGFARNIGIDLAKGKYLFFFDDDDWIENGMITEMYQMGRKKKYDLVICGYSQDIVVDKRIKNRKKNIMPSCEILKKEEIIKKIPEIDYYKSFSYVWNKMYLSKIIKKNNIKFNSKMFGEDFDFNLKYFQYIESLKIMDKVFYHYVKHSKNSLTERKIENFFENIEQRFSDLELVLSEEKVESKKSKQYFGIVVAKHLLSTIVREFELKEKKRREIVKKIFCSELYKKTQKNMKGLKLKEKIYCFILRKKLTIFLIILVEIINFVKKKNKVLFQIFK